MEVACRRGIKSTIDNVPEALDKIAREIRDKKEAKGGKTWVEFGAEVIANFIVEHFYPGDYDSMLGQARRRLMERRALEKLRVDVSACIRLAGEKIQERMLTEQPVEQPNEDGIPVGV